MNREQTKNLISEEIKDFIDVCPHCEAKVHLQMIFNDSHRQDNGDILYFITFRCIPCKKLVLETYRFKQNRCSHDEDLSVSGWESKFPTAELMMTQKFEGVVPDEVLTDYREGVVSLNNRCPRAAVSMFRRSLQSALLNLGAKKSDELIEQIKKLGTLTDDIKDWAHNIRIFGNWGAHPQNDNLKDVDPEKAEEARSFLEEFFNYVYVMPHRVKRARGEEAEGEEESEENTKTQAT